MVGGECDCLVDLLRWVWLRDGLEVMVEAERYCGVCVDWIRGDGEEWRCFWRLCGRGVIRIFILRFAFCCSEVEGVMRDWDWDARRECDCDCAAGVLGFEGGVCEVTRPRCL